MIRILCVSGSLRADVYNTALLRAAQSLVGPTIALEVATLRGVPAYDDALRQREGLPVAVRALKDMVVASDAMLLTTPEHTSGIPGVLKNAIDWLSRPRFESSGIFADRPCAMIGASPNVLGTILAQVAWLPVLRALEVRYWTGGRLLVSRAQQVFDVPGAIQDDTVRFSLARFITGFAAFAAERPASHVA